MKTAQIASWYNKKYKQMGGGWKIGPEESIRLINWAKLDSSEGRLLDIGCGDGDFISHVYKHFKFCIGIDLSSVAIDYANKKELPVLFALGNVEKLIYKDGSFDYLTSVGSIEHVEDINKALKECYRVLKTGGKFLCLVPNELWPHKDQPSEQTHTDKAWGKLFTVAGFEVEKLNRRNDLTDFLLTK